MVRKIKAGTVRKHCDSQYKQHQHHGISTTAQGDRSRAIHTRPKNQPGLPSMWADEVKTVISRIQPTNIKTACAMCTPNFPFCRLWTENSMMGNVVFVLHLFKKIAEGYADRGEKSSSRQ